MKQAMNTASQSQLADEDPRRGKGLNATAYRIFKLLEWLIESPLSVEALNRRFYEDPLIARQLSSDSIWLYINTLKALGCHIKRPSPRNGFCYELLAHPFGLALEAPELETLGQVKAFAQNHLDHTEVMILDGMLHKVIDRCLDGKSPQGEALMDTLFSQSRSLDYAGSRELIERLKGWMAENKLLRISYHSPASGESTFRFLPEALAYEQGVLYVKGDRPEYPDPSLLRLDRILHAGPVEDPTLREELMARRKALPEIKIHLENPDTLSGVEIQKIRKLKNGWSALTVCTRDFFSLRQQLLSCGSPFRVLAPTDFQKEMHAVLKAMLAWYPEEDT